ncbi:class I SAM-dependent DNA methyltransferase [Aquicoccus sp. G2-2]|uniref:HsdM family class I SAM-dependent methyltransferase n=1 Tax=Aquicoccus sp. G2-2 TaxID=3092120 RepID=UPI002ADF6C4E|nr:N-6 DNA methylase [Aquicoccus sp. G2-2]MEA1113198.1 N-6 DNA methylase [Aquicoccus sp. G2-2]
MAVAPLFSPTEIDSSNSHNVLLDGGLGSFALSVGEAAEEHRDSFKSWSWSSNLAHHVALNDKQVHVSRWDKADVEVLTRSSVEKRLGAFYKYLIADKVRSNQRVTNHFLDLFRSMRSVISDAGRNDHLSVSAFLAFIESQTDTEEQSSEGLELLKSLSPSSLANLRERASQLDVFSSSLKLLPRLAIRHAGSEIFQEAHYEFLRAPSPDLFGYVGPAETSSKTRGGAHFTPPALARSLCEQTLHQIENVHERNQLTILDPACGSGAFLHEAARTLQRMGFMGKLRLVGRDISQPAICMAEFALRHARMDWSPAGGIEVDLRSSDSLQGDMPAADVVLMNPPFVSWASLDQNQRELMRNILGRSLSGRADLSMAFVTKALASINDGGVLGALLPSSLLTLQAAEAWRASLLDHGTLRLIASLGDHGLFSHALVSVSAMVIDKGVSKSHKPPVRALIASNSKEATGEALRALRRGNSSQHAAASAPTWRLFDLNYDTFEKRPTWRLMRPEMERLVGNVIAAGARPIDALFDVKQGVRTGSNKVFLLNRADFLDLPETERVFFRPAIINESISAGRIASEHWVFYPYGQLASELQSESDLATKVSRYYSRFLKPNKTALTQRSSITRSGRSDWWGLSERRTWSLNGCPRIVSKYFGGTGGFSADIDAEYVVVQGHAWLPRWLPTDEQYVDQELDDASKLTLETVLYAYSALMNSAGFSSIIEIFSPHVAGGQFDLSPRYVNSIPIPDLPSIVADMDGGRIVGQLARLGREPRPENSSWRARVESLVEDLYGTQLVFEE